MEYNKDYFIFGEPIETIFGKVRFLTYREYLTKQSQLSLMSMSSLHIYYYFKEIDKNISKEELEELKKLKDTPLLDIVMDIPVFKDTYKTMFQTVIEFKDSLSVEDIFSENEIFMQMRKLVLDMNVTVEAEVSPNEEIQRAIERSRRVKQAEAEKQTFVDIITSIVSSTNNSFEDVCNMNVMQVYAIYARIGAIFNYKTSTLFATVAEKVDIELWNKHIDLFEQKSDTLTENEFKSKFGGIFNL